MVCMALTELDEQVEAKAAKAEAASAYCHITSMLTTVWAKWLQSKGVDTGARIQYFAGGAKEEAEDAAAIYSIYMRLADPAVHMNLVAMCIHPREDLIDSGPIHRIQEFLASATGECFEALKLTYRKEDYGKLYSVLRDTALGVITGFYPHDPVAKKEKPSDAMARLHRSDGTKQLKEAFKKCVPKSNQFAQGQHGLMTKRDIKAGEHFIIPGNVFSTEVSLNSTVNTDYYWDLSHGTVLRCEGLARLMNDPRGVPGAVTNVEVVTSQPRDQLHIKAKMDIKEGEEVWLDYGANFWSEDEK